MSDVFYILYSNAITLKLITNHPLDTPNSTRRWANLESDKEGFYLSHQARNGKQTAILCCRIDAPSTPSHSNANANASNAAQRQGKAPIKSKETIMFQLYRPNTGLQFRTESLAEIEKKYRKVQSDQAERHWTQQYDASVNTCSHAYWRGNCRNVSMGQDCEVRTASMVFMSDWY